MVLASAVALLIGMWRLFADRKWAIIARYFLALAIYVWLWRAVGKVENPDLRLWLLMPLIFLIPACLMSGFLVYKASDGQGFFEPAPSKAWDTPPGGLAKGMAVACIFWGIGCFIYGVVNTSTFGTDSPWPVVITYLPFAYGIYTLRPRR
jgi:hypothetical protein